MHIKRRVFEFHQNNVEFFLLAIIDYNELEFIATTYIELMKSIDDVHRRDIRVFDNRRYNVNLQRQEIII